MSGLWTSRRCCLDPVIYRLNDLTLDTKSLELRHGEEIVPVEENPVRLLVQIVPSRERDIVRSDRPACANRNRQGAIINSPILLSVPVLSAIHIQFGSSWRLARTHQQCNEIIPRSKRKGYWTPPCEGPIPPATA